MLGESQKQIGTIGEVHPLVVEQYAMRVEKEQPVMAADLDLNLILNNMQDTFKVDPVPVYPAVG